MLRLARSNAFLLSLFSLSCVVGGDYMLDGDDDGASDVHGANVETPDLEFEIGAATDTLDLNTEVDFGGVAPTQITVDVIDAVGAPGASVGAANPSARATSVHAMITRFNSLVNNVGAATTPRPPSLVVGLDYQYIRSPSGPDVYGGVGFIAAMNTVRPRGHLSVILVSEATMARLRIRIEACGVRMSAIPNAVLLSYVSGCVEDGPGVVPHEVGHWLGLDHTFGSGNRGATRCVDLDGIDDTAVHLGTGLGYRCGAALPDSCPSHAGSDPFDNVMSYGCAARFSAGQVRKMGRTWAAVWRSRGFTGS